MLADVVPIGGAGDIPTKRISLGSTGPAPSHCIVRRLDLESMPGWAVLGTYSHDSRCDRIVWRNAVDLESSMVLSGVGSVEGLQKRDGRGQEGHRMSPAS